LKLDTNEAAVYFEGEIDASKRKAAASAYAQGLSSVFSKLEPEEVPKFAAKALAIKGMVKYENGVFVLTWIDLPVRDQATVIGAFYTWSSTASLSTTEKLSLVLNMGQSASDLPQRDGYVRLRNELIKTFDCMSEPKQ
jgi:hypothetical protein